MPDQVVIDTNILFSALLSRESRLAATILRAEVRFFITETLIVELFEHKERLSAYSKQNETELLRTLQDLLRRVRLYPEEMISPEHWENAYRLCHSIDATDTPHVALALELDALLWTGDKKLREGLRRQGFERFWAAG